MTRQAIHLFESSTGNLVPAELLRGLTAVDLFETESVWGPERHRMVKRLIDSGTSIDHIPKYFHWNWARKAQNLKLLDAECLGIECQSVIQGLMLIRTAIYSARLAPAVDKPLVYIDYLEAAPWNTTHLTIQPRYKLVGTKLFEAAVAVSRSMDFHGRVGLHSLPLSESFYRRCHMTDCGIDTDYENLSYFELTSTTADEHWKGV